jgi:D-arabinose 1-dehydrogenase-like Zn-dependent alcohol dehydrogenase
VLAAQAEGLAIKREPHTNRVPRSQRGGEVVEPLVRPCSECQGREQGREQFCVASRWES